MVEVSIIMGVYNSERTLKRALDSILKQTYNNWIMIMCDDGSKDASYELMCEYKNKYPDKFLIMKNQKNMGLTRTLNRCLGKVSTPFVARMDTDDVCRPERLERQVAFMKEHPEYSIVGTSYVKFDENGIWGQVYPEEQPGKRAFLWNSPFAHPTVMMRTEDLKSVHGYHACKRTERCEDYDLWFRMYANGFRGYNMQEILFEYYEGQNSYPNRKYRFRINEAKTRFAGYKKLHMLPGAILYVIKPLLVGLLPMKYIAKYKHEKEKN